MPSPSVALTIAGSDCCGGAGIQADLKTFQHFGVHGLTAVTCVVSETPAIVEAVHAIPSELVASQVSLLLDAYPVAAIKTGMLHSREVVESVADCLAPHPDIPLVVDPVMVASSGSPLIEADAIEAYRKLLFPRATLITPNLDEAATLLGHRIESLQAMEGAALRMADELGIAVLLKGGHLQQGDCVDLLAAGGGLESFTHPRIPDADTHGTGCTLAAAIAAGLALGLDLASAVGRAGDFLASALRSRYRLGELEALNQGTLRDSLENPTT